jgi:epsilon-lactone hydrolase
MTARRVGQNLRMPALVVRMGVRQLGRHCLNPALAWDVQRHRMDKLTRMVTLPRGTTIARQVIGGVPADVVSAREVGRPSTVVHFHGGGYCVGSARTARAWAAHLSAQTGCRVVLPEYRLAPEHPHPAALEDARVVLRALGREAGAASLVVSGDSAGGGLALALVMTQRDDGAELPAGCVLLSPWLDLGRDRTAVADLVRRDILLSPEWLEACARAYADPGAWTAGMVSPLCGSHQGCPRCSSRPARTSCSRRMPGCWRRAPRLPALT